MSVRSDGRGGVTVERIAVWAVAVLAVAALVVLAVGAGAQFRTATPTSAFEGSYDAASGTVTVTHTGGAALTDRNTDRVAVVVTDADNGTTTRLYWANESRGLPVTEGDSFAVDDPSVDSNGDGDYLDADGSVGFYLEPGDTVDVVWTGHRPGAPQTQTATLGTVTVGNATG